MKRNFYSITCALPLLFIGLSAQSQTYNRIIPDSVYYDFINKDILRDSVKITLHIFRKRIPLNPDDFYYKDSADFVRKNNGNNSFFIFSNHFRNGRVISNNLDSLFTRKDIDYFGEQLHAMKKRKSWKKPFINSVFIDKVEYDETDKNIFGRRTKYGLWGYSLPLFSPNRCHAIIIKYNSVKVSYYVYRLNDQRDWELIKEFNTWAID